MNAENEKTRRLAENTIAGANRELEKGTKNLAHHQMLTATIRDATETIKNLNETHNDRPYSNTNIGYGADARGRNESRDDMHEKMTRMMDAVNKILPQIADDYSNDYEADDGAEMRRGVKGTGKSRKSVRVAGYTRRADMDGMDNMDNMNYTSEASMRSEHEHRMNEHEHRMRMHEERMREHEARMAANARGTNDVYPTTPVMPRSDYRGANDARGNARADARNEGRSEGRNAADDDYSRSDDRTSDRSNRVGPDMRR